MKANHLAFACNDNSVWTLKNKKPLSESYRKSFKKILSFIEFQIEKNIPITTYYIMRPTDEVSRDHDVLVESLTGFLTMLASHKIMNKKRIKFSVIGKWYTLPPKLIDAIKNLIDITKDNDEYFVNFCINYDGQDEFVDATKMIARRVKFGKLDVENITKETVKEDLYSSYFLPPDYMFVTGKQRSTGGFLLWDSINTDIIFSKNYFIDLSTRFVAKTISGRKN